FRNAAETAYAAKKPVATTIVPEDYICTQGDLALIDFIKEIPCEPRVEVVLIDDAFVERKSMECLFQLNAYLDDEVFIPINIRETHWYLVVIHSRNMEIQVLDSLGTSQQDRKDLTDCIKGLQRQTDMIYQRKELKDHRWPDLQVASWPLKEIEMAYAKQTYRPKGEIINNRKHYMDMRFWRMVGFGKLPKYHQDPTAE
ncbi:hypothetical protein ACJX0J_005879, partial [Zea mays]